MQETAKTNKHYDYNGSFFIKISTLLIIISAIIYLYSSNQEPQKAPIAMVFYQPLLKDKMNWNSNFKKLHQAGVDTIILQWSKFGVVDFLKKEKWLKNILHNAQNHNIKVVVGLYGDDKYFKTLEKKETNVEIYLNSLLHKNILQAKKIYNIAQKYNSFSGYYIYDEIDDTNFININKEKYLTAYLKSMAKSLKKISSHRLYISSYFSKHMPIEEYIGFISDIVDNRYTLLLQSGIGANLVNEKESSRYMKIFSKKFKGDFIPIVESFKMNKGKIEAIDIDSLKRQIDILSKSANSSKLALFSLRYFLEDELFTNYCIKKSTIR